MASKITDATINFIRSVFGREQQKQELSVSGRELAKLAARYGGQLPGIDVSGVLSGDLFSLDKRRLYRYVDYEEMDLYPEISSALDIYSDDSTQTDSTTNKSIWIECNDEKIRKDLDDMFYKRLIIEEKIWPWTRNLCKYGDDFEEIIVSDGEGVIDLSFLPTPTMWKVENDHGDGLGYVQSFSQNFSIDIKKFEELTKKGIDGGAKVNEQSDIAIFDNWRVCHTRLLSKHREAIYGMGVAEPARWIWKRLTLLEDAVMVFKLCLRGDSKIWTDSGSIPICDLEEGDCVFSYSPGGALKKTKVVYKKHNGKDRIFRIKSKHREIYANATHPVLVEWFVGNGSGKERTRFQEYVEVKDIKPGKHRFVTPSVEDDTREYVKLEFPDVGQKAKISEDAIADGKASMNVGIKQLQDNCGVGCRRIKDFFAGNYEINIGAAIRLLKENGTSLDVLDVFDDWGGAKPSLPDVANEDFARFFGFMIGDGYVSETPFRSKYGNTYFVRRIGFTSGDDRETNEKYLSLFEKFFGKATFYRDKRSKHDCVGNFTISSKAAVEFMLLNGYIPGARNKRIPGWVFQSPVSVRMAFLDGLADADGHRQPMTIGSERDRVGFERATIELCNENLANDIRELCMQSGLVVQFVHERFRKGGREILENGFPLPDRNSYVVSFSYDRMPLSEVIDSVNEVDSDDIWDIGVEAEEHNFIANGVVVHNTRSPSRYAFYVDVTGTSNQQADRAIQDVVNRIKKKKFVDPNTGKLNLKFSPLAFDEDFFLGVRDGKESVRVDSLNGPNYQQIEDVQYFLNKLYAALKIPKAYLGYEENLPSKATLSSEDIRYGRTVLRIQRELRNGLRKIANVHLAARKIDPASVDFEIMMTVPSSISELGQMEIRRARADLANSMQAHVSLYWLLSNVYGMSDDEIQKISQQKKEEQKMAAAGGGGRFGGFESVAGKGRPITEQELMRGNREHEKRIEEIVRSEFEKSNTKIGAQLRETGLLVRDILRASQR